MDREKSSRDGWRDAGVTHAGKAARIDKRVPTTLWPLTVWTYRQQKAHLDSGRIGGVGHRAVSQTAAVIERLLLGGVTIKTSPVSRTLIDADALTVHEMVLRMRPHERALIIDQAALGSPPDWNPRFPPVEVIPVLRGNGKPKMLYPPRRHEPIACLITYKGVPPQQAGALRERARERYREWFTSLVVLGDALVRMDELTRWALRGTGVDGEPWRSSL